MGTFSKIMAGGASGKLSGIGKRIGGFFGITGAEEAAGRSAEELRQIGSGLRSRFTPIRIKSLLGEGSFGPEGFNFGGGYLDKIGEQLNAFNEGDATKRTLDILRARNQQFFNPQLSNLESRLMAQGRLGLGTGNLAESPEMASFFSAQQGADLEAQLAAMGESRAQRESLLQSYLAPLSFFTTSLLGGEQTRAARDIAASNIEAGAPRTELEGKIADQNAVASFWSGLFGAGAKAIGGGSKPG